MKESEKIRLYQHRYLEGAALTRWLSLFFLLFSLSAQAGLSDLFSASPSQPDFLPVEEAFQVSATLSGNDLSVDFKVHPEHYLYRYQMKFERVDTQTDLSASAIFPAGKMKFDEFQQRELEVYPEDLSVHLPFADTLEFLELDVSYQGCADAGLCYPPQTQRIAVLNQQVSPGKDNNASQNLGLSPEQLAASSLYTQAPASPAAAQAAELSDDGYFTDLLQGSQWWFILGLFLLAGLGLTFTPCVLPMIPILSSMIINQNAQQALAKTRVFSLSLSYVLGMSISFAFAGVLMAEFGAALNLQAKLQSPWVLIPFALIFALLALSMFGLFELQLPSALRDRLQSMSSKTHGGSLKNAFVLGVVSSLVVSPCVSAPLAGALVYIGSTGDALLGGLALFMLGLGMGLPLLAMAIGGASLLPKAGAWMDSVKNVFGILLLGVAIWLLERIIPGPLSLLLWGALLACSAIYMGALNFSSAPKHAKHIISQGLGLCLLAYALSLVAGAAQGNSDPLRPLHFNSVSGSNSAHEFIVVRSLNELELEIKRAAAAGQPSFVDFYADWCISCKVTERELFPRPSIAPKLEQYTLIKADVTANGAEEIALLKHFNIFGPPAMLIYDKQGLEASQLRLMGEPSASSLERTLAQGLELP